MVCIIINMKIKSFTQQPLCWFIFYMDNIIFGGSCHALFVKFSYTNFRTTQESCVSFI
jgi:hypothetical protein